MKAVMLSLRPQWADKIFNGIKTIEVRKSRPSLDMPFRVYVYQTKHKGGKEIVSEVFNSVYGGGKVIGEFVCDKIEKIDIQAQITTTLSERWTFNGIAKQACLTAEQLEEYLNGGMGYGWHITEPKLYDKPKELGEFRKPCGLGTGCEDCDDIYFMNCKNTLARPPQSWRYVEELQ